MTVGGQTLTLEFGLSMVSNTFSSKRKKTRISAGFDIKSLREAIINMAPRGGLEPPTNGLTAHAKTLKNG